jgi:hypothetical protein
MKTLYNHILILLLFAIALFSSCAKDRVSANGDVITQTRGLSGFNSIQSSGANPVYIKYGPEFKVEIKGSSNLMAYYKTEVRGNTLHAGFKRASIEKDDIRLYLTLPYIKDIDLSGSGNTEITGSFPEQESLGVRISGSANVTAEDAFSSRNIQVAVSGSGDVDLSRVSCESADVKISGSGDVRLAVSDYLKVGISGSGNVYYTGNPQTDTKVSGSGQIIAVN